MVNRVWAVCFIVAATATVHSLYKGVHCAFTLLDLCKDAVMMQNAVHLFNGVKDPIRKVKD